MENKHKFVEFASYKGPPVQPSLAERCLRLLHLSWLVLLPLSTIVIVLIAWREACLSVVMIYVLFFGAGMLCVRLLAPRDTRKRLYALFASIYAYNALIVVVMFLLFLSETGEPYLPGSTDDMWFDQCGEYLAPALLSGERVEFPSYRMEHYRGYITLIAGVHLVSHVAGPGHTINPRLLNSLAVGLMSVICFLLAARCGLSRTAGLLSAFAIGILPVQAFWSAIIVRDILVLFFVVLGLYSFSQIDLANARRSLVWIAWLAFSAFGVYAMRPASALMFALLLGALVYYRYILSLGSLSVLVGLAPMIVVLVVTAPFLRGQIDVVEAMAEQCGYRLTAHAGFSALVLQQPLFPFGVILRPIYALVSPIPSVSGWGNTFMGAGTLPWLLLLPFAFIGLRNCLQDSHKAVIAIAAVVLLLSTSLTTFQERHLSVFRPFVILLGFYGMGIARRPARVLVGAVAAYALLGLLYMFLRVT